MSTTTTTTTRDRGDRYGPMEWAQLGYFELEDALLLLVLRKTAVCKSRICYNKTLITVTCVCPSYCLLHV